MTKKQIPDFKTIEEMARFFDTVDTTDLDLEDVDFVFSRPRARDNISPTRPIVRSTRGKRRVRSAPHR